MEERNEAVTHTSEYQRCPIFISVFILNNDSTAWLSLLVNLPCLPPRVAKETVNEINLRLPVKKIGWRG